MQLNNFKQNMEKNSYKLGMHSGRTYSSSTATPPKESESNFMCGNIQHYLIY